MTVRETDQSEDRLILQSQLSEMAQIPTWIEALSSRHAIPEDLSFSINLCLEEAVSNVIRHGYGPDTGGSVIVRFALPKPDLFVFIVEDQAQRFNPLDANAPNPQAPPQIGGRGINYLREFASLLEYEPTPTGNRLKIGFSTANTMH